MYSYACHRVLGMPTISATRSRAPIAIAVWVVAALVLGSCSSSTTSSSEDAPTGESSASSDAFPVTIEHKYGTTEITEKPVRVVSVGYQDQDPILALGVVPVGLRDWFGDKPSATWPWAEGLLDGETPVVLPSAEINFEQVLDLEPDLIVGISSGMSETDYQRLSEIAPTLVQTADQPDFQETWQTQTRMIGQALGESGKADQLIGEVEDRLDAEAKDNPELAGKEGTMSYLFEDGSIGAYGPGDARSRLLTDLGMVIPREVIEAAGDQFYSQFSLEQIGMLDHDVLVWLTYQPDAVARLEASPLRQQLDAATQGREIFMTELQAGAASFSSVLSIPYLLDTLVPQLAAAVDGDPSTTPPAAA
jgi:iron complex transport system substrate-binding protein